ncbi:MAG: GNVR domain-containing protein, partial [Candidatus Omnitrophota bacterium]|nr:GNVR domain-containing protein [Candidatus Omnitrophota bacterium]
RLQQKIGVGMRGRDLVSIAYEDRDPEMTQRLVNTITNIYMERNAESQTAEAQTAIGFIEDEMAVYKKKLEESELALREFKELYVMQMPVANQLNDQVVELEVLLAQMLVENTEEHPTVLQTRNRIAELKRTRNDELKRVIATAMVKGHDPSFYEDLMKVLSDTTASAKPQDPALQRAMEAYQAIVKRMDNPMAPAPAAATPPIQVVTTPGGAADAAFEVLGAESASLSLSPREEQELVRLTRDYRVHSKTYQSMQGRLERAKTTERLEASDEGMKFKVLEPARLPLRPIRPNFVKLFFFSLMLGMVVGAGIAFVAEYLDQSFQSAEEVQVALELPVIGSISTIVTEADVEAQHRRRMSWMSWKANIARFKTYMINPIWARVDRVMVRWGL